MTLDTEEARLKLREYPYNMVKAAYATKKEPLPPQLPDDIKPIIEYALAGLHERTQDVLISVYRGGHQIEEIADYSGVTIERIRQVQERGLKAIHEAVQDRLNAGCEFCKRDKPIKAHMILPDCGLQCGPSAHAVYCPICGRRL